MTVIEYQSMMMLKVLNGTVTAKTAKAMLKRAIQLGVVK